MYRYRQKKKPCDHDWKGARSDFMWGRFRSCPEQKRWGTTMLINSCRWDPERSKKSALTSTPWETKRQFHATRCGRLGKPKERVWRFANPPK